MRLKLPSLKRFSTLELCFLIVFIALFVYFRVSPIINQTVPYTFDQGRDFLKVEETVRHLHPAILGPTTGIPGMYHGVWWYYFLTIPFILANGAPLGFYFFIFFVSVVQVSLFYLFLREITTKTIALIFLGLVTTSSYFITLAIFPINSVQAPPFILFFIFSLYMFFKTKKPEYEFLLFFTLAMIFESEIAFGLFMLPGAFLTFALTRSIKPLTQSRKHINYGIAGFLIPIAPHIFAELLRKFGQTRTLIHSLISPHLYNPRPFNIVIIERFQYFIDYYNRSFFNGNGLIGIVFLVTALLGLYIGFKKLTSEFRKTTIIISVTLVFTFIFSLFYHDNFWSYYFEGMSYFFMFLLFVGFFGFQFHKNKFVQKIPLMLLIIVVIFTAQKVNAEIFHKSDAEKQGLIEQVNVVKYIYSQVGINDVCVRIYTPPVIPHTYNYLFSYYTQGTNRAIPTTKYVADECYYVFEKDPYQFRIDQFRKDHIPEGAVMLDTHPISLSIWVEHWRFTP